ncbi:unnamed protein product [Brassica napus]|uniref:(rape) hypothetical protein n=1 Tax=Brassica napus TaxID=3708 RepID=A0A816P9G6_BRANA|nr:unnamed protein product [Brassica napus]CAF2143076.1 unnamed protein product [Brassica napus]
MGISLCPPAPNQTHTLTDTENVGDWHISPLALLHSGPLLDFDLLPGCCSSMAALSLPSLPNVLISDTCGEAYGLCE